jgi:hypothetical protein
VVSSLRLVAHGSGHGLHRDALDRLGEFVLAEGWASGEECAEDGYDSREGMAASDAM